MTASLHEIFHVAIDAWTLTFLGEHYWEVTNDGIVEGYPKLITSRWPGLPSRLDAAILLDDGETLFMKVGYKVINSLKGFCFIRWSYLFRILPGLRNLAIQYGQSGNERRWSRVRWNLRTDHTRRDTRSKGWCSKTGRTYLPPDFWSGSVEITRGSIKYNIWKQHVTKLMYSIISRFYPGVQLIFFFVCQ